MTKISEAIQSIQSMYSKGVQSKDSRLTSRQIYFELVNARSTIIRQKSSKGQFIGEWSYQTISGVELIKSTQDELDCIIDNECVVLRTKFPLPKIIPDISKDLIKSVTDGSERFEIQEYQNIRYNRGNRFTSKKSKFILKNGYGYLTIKRLLKSINIEAMFEDPIDVYMFPTICDDCEDCKCKDVVEIEFPIDRPTLDTIVGMAYNSLLANFLQMSDDKKDNASDDIGTRMLHQPQQQQPQDDN